MLQYSSVRLSGVLTRLVFLIYYKSALIVCGRGNDLSHRLLIVSHDSSFMRMIETRVKEENSFSGKL
jgi:hypothetical protein